MSVIKNLYPPIIATYMPAFIRTGSCKVVFSLSSYNSLSDIKSADILLRYQTTDSSALTKINGDDRWRNIPKEKISYIGNEEYAITISPSMLKSGVFEENVLYKLQIRFRGENDSESEWSTVCLLMGINKPSVYLKGLDVQLLNIANNITSRIPQTLDIIGTVTFNEDESTKKEKEYLFSWDAKIYDNNTSELVYSTDTVFTKTFFTPNEIKYTVPYTFELNKTYIMYITFITNNGYVFSKKYSFKTVESSILEPPCTIAATPRESLGAIDITLTATGTYRGNLTIRRASSKTNFSVWEDIYTNLVSLNTTDEKTFVIHDSTIESGVLYKYLVQKRTPNGDRGRELKTEEPIMIVFDDTYLMGTKGKQFCIKFNNNINSITWNKQESKTETLGSQYAYIRKNSSVFYRSFPISGTISYLGDTFEETELEKAVIASGDSIEREPSEYEVDEPLFYNRKKELGEEVYNIYDKYNKDHQIKPLDDIIYEKEFRDKVIEFFEDGKVKLFRSPTEGNILIRLMDISYSPNQTLGRKIYDFSATAIEVDKVDFDTLYQYDLFDTGNPTAAVKSNYDIIGQLEITNMTDIYTEIFNHISNYQTDDMMRQLVALKGVRLTFTSEPSLIDGIYGYKIFINNEEIIVNRNGIYQIYSDDESIERIAISADDTVLVDYVANIDEIEKIAVPKMDYDYFTIGQVYDYVKPNTDIIKIIKNKYEFLTDSIEQHLKNIYTLKIEADEGTYIELKTKDSDDISTFILGDNEMLNFSNSNYSFDSFVVKGTLLKRYKGEGEPLQLGKNEFYIKDTALSQDNILNPKENYIYHFQHKESEGYLLEIEDIYNSAPLVAENNTVPEENGLVLVSRKYIYYNGAWKIFQEIDEDNIIVQENIHVIVDYSCSIDGKEY